MRENELFLPVDFSFNAMLSVEFWKNIVLSDNPMRFMPENGSVFRTESKQITFTIEYIETARKFLWQRGF